MRVRFDEVFNVSNGMITPKLPVHINGVTMGPGVSFGHGVSFGGIDLTKYLGKDLDVEQDANGVVTIKGVFEY